MTALHCAVCNGFVDIVKVILKNPYVNIKIPDQDGKSVFETCRDPQEKDNQAKQIILGLLEVGPSADKLPLYLVDLTY